MYAESEESRSQRELIMIIARYKRDGRRVRTECGVV